MSKSILITGASSGIGLCAAQTLQQRGYRVIATVRQEKDKKMLEQFAVTAVLMDLQEPSSIEQAVAQVFEQTGGTLDALFNNAGYIEIGATEDLSNEALRAQLETNVFGLHQLTRTILPVMHSQGHGRIVNMGSVLSLISLPYRGAYCASKFALKALTDALRLELRLTGSPITVSLIQAGPIKSQLHRNAEAIYEKRLGEKMINPERYKLALKEIKQITLHRSRFVISPDAVVKKLIYALENPKPKAYYYVTPLAYLGALSRILPSRLQDFIFSKI